MMTGSNITGNSVHDEFGGAHFTFTTANITSTTISGNNSGIYVGGAYLTGTTLTFTGNTVANNHSTGSVGGLYVFVSGTGLNSSTITAGFSGNSAALPAAAYTSAAAATARWPLPAAPSPITAPEGSAAAFSTL